MTDLEFDEWKAKKETALFTVIGDPDKIDEWYREANNEAVKHDVFLNDAEPLFHERVEAAFETLRQYGRIDKSMTLLDRKLFDRLRAEDVVSYRKMGSPFAWYARIHKKIFNGVTYYFDEELDKEEYERESKGKDEKAI